MLAEEALGLVPQRSSVGGEVFAVKGFGAGVVLRGEKRRRSLVGACGIGVGEFLSWDTR